MKKFTNKNALPAALLALTVSTAALAGGGSDFSEGYPPEHSCRDHFQNILDARKEAALSALMGHGLFAMAIYPIVALPLPGIYFLAATAKPRRLVKLMDQAESCSGGLIQRFYKRYRDQVSDPMSFIEFCQTIHRADMSGKLCSGKTALPSKSTLIDWIDLNH